MTKHKKQLMPLALIGAIVTLLGGIPVLSFAKNGQKIQGSLSVHGKSKKDYPAIAKISLQEAIAIVGKDHPGKVIEVSLDSEDEFLVYEFEILGSDQKKKEILVDAGNGKTLLVKGAKKDSDDDDEDNE